MAGQRRPQGVPRVSWRPHPAGMADDTSPVYEARYGWDLKTMGVVLWRQDLGGNFWSHGMPYAGVVRREGAPPLPGSGPRGRALLEHLVPVPADVAVSSQAVNGRRFDKERLNAVVAHYAPACPCGTATSRLSGTDVSDRRVRAAGPTGSSSMNPVGSRRSAGGATASARPRCGPEEGGERVGRGVHRGPAAGIVLGARSPRVPTMCATAHVTGDIGGATVVTRNASLVTT